MRHIAQLLLAACLALGACSGSGTGPKDGGGEAAPDVATTAYCVKLDQRCKKGDKPACTEHKDKCPFTYRDAGR